MSETITTPQAETPVETKAEDPSEGRRSLRWSTILIWGGVIGLLALLGWGLLNANEGRPESGATAPNFEVQFFDGYGWQDMEQASLEDFRGQVVVLNFWASWCVECRVEADLLENTWQRYRDQGVVFLGVAYVDSEPKSLAYLEEFDITYPNGPDLGSSVSNAYKITGVPETFFIGKDGTVAEFVLGPVNASKLENQIQTLLAQ
jgi:cytochrome c biogenesis protein CcmG/thiol:disulfide interchange protein DsbE